MAALSAVASRASNPTRATCASSSCRTPLTSGRVIVLERRADDRDRSRADVRARTEASPARASVASVAAVAALTARATIASQPTFAANDDGSTVGVRTIRAGASFATTTPANTRFTGGAGAPFAAYSQIKAEGDTTQRDRPTCDVQPAARARPTLATLAALSTILSVGTGTPIRPG